jgi:predicted small secreted protein
MKEVFISKDALSKGVYKEKITISKNQPEKAYGLFNIYYKGEWHLTEDKAIEAAEKMRLERIKLLEEELIRVKEKQFTKAGNISGHYIYKAE